MRGRKSEIIKTILEGLKVGTVISMAIFAPNALQALKIFDQKKFREAISNLKKRNLIEIKIEKGEEVISLTKEGEKQVKRYKFDELKIEKPKRWDGKWRIVIFDVPEKKKLAREVLREKLKSLGFYQLQKSVFIHPYECEDQIEIIKKVYEIWPYVNYILAEKIDQEDKIKAQFNL